VFHYRLGFDTATLGRRTDRIEFLDKNQRAMRIDENDDQDETKFKSKLDQTGRDRAS